MKDVAVLIQAISGFAWPLTALIILVVILPVLKGIVQAVQREGGAVEVAGFKFTVQENSEQQRKIIESIQQSLADVQLKVEGKAVERPLQAAKKRIGKVLWVDDSPRNNAYIRAFLEDKGVSVDLALNTDQGLDKVKHVQYDAVITDMARPGDQRAGLTLTRILRSNSCQLPVLIFCNPWAAEHLAEDASEAGAEGITSSAQELISMLTAYAVV